MGEARPPDGDEQLTLDDDDWVTNPTRRFANMTQVDVLRDDLAKQTRRHTPRQPCRSCGSDDAYLKREGIHEGVYCAKCGTHNYWAPGTETGRKPRTVANLRNKIPARQRARILDRDNARCVLCGCDRGPLHVGHLLSVEDGIALGVGNELLYDDANLAAMCETCNLGLPSSVTARTYATLMWRLVQAEQRRETPTTNLTAILAPTPEAVVDSAD